MYNNVGPAPVYVQGSQPGMYYGSQPGVIAVQPAGQMGGPQPMLGHTGSTTVMNVNPARAHENKAFTEIRNLSTTAENIHKASVQNPRLYFDVRKRQELVVQLSETNTNLEDLTIKMSVSLRSLIADPAFRGELLVMANKLQRMLGQIKELKSPIVTSGCCCCTSQSGGEPYHGDPKLKAVCEDLFSKVATFRGGEAFKLDLNTTGGVSVTGQTSAAYEAGGVSMAEQNQEQLANVQMAAPGQYYN